MKKNAIFTWGLVGIITVSMIVNIFSILENRSSVSGIAALASNLVGVLILPAFAIVGALIVSRQPRNAIGWLLLLPAVTGSLVDVESYIRSFTTPPLQPPLQLLLSLWLSGVGWLLLIFPLFFIPVLFPTGSPPSPRWRWLIIAGLGMCAIFIFLYTFNTSFSAADFGMDWAIANPIGFIPMEELGGTFLVIWGIGLLLMAVLSVASLFVRYRRAVAVEREQIKWLLFACALFGVFYTASFPFNTVWSGTILNDVADLLWVLSLIGIPVSIAIAILRYRLWDIDVIIRRTLVYGALTLTLGLVYFGSVILLQSLVNAVGGQQSAAVTVISTLLIAALFTPLRHRIQNDIDRRFYRRKYDAQKTLQSFAASVRNEVELEEITAHLLRVVEETLQPESASLWLRSTEDRKPKTEDGLSYRYPVIPGEN